MLTACHSKVLPSTNVCSECCVLNRLCVLPGTSVYRADRLRVLAESFRQGLGLLVMTVRLPNNKRGKPQMAEYRIEELAAASGTTVRTLQSYRQKGLLPAPRRVGRIALYAENHIDRLELIARLVRRGYSLNAVAELLEGLDRGELISDLLGLDETIESAGDAAPEVITLRQLGAAGEDEDAVATLIRLGMIEPIKEEDGDQGTGAGKDPLDRRFRLVLPGVLAAGTTLVAAGIPLGAVLEEGLRLQRDAEAIAARFVRLAMDHVIAGGAVTPEARASTVTDLVRPLLPYAPQVIGDYVQAALQRRIHEVIESEIDHLLDEDPSPARSLNG